MIKVESMGKKYGLLIAHKGEELKLVFKQLNYFQRNNIATKTTRYVEGQLIMDAGLTAFYNIKYGLKEVYGLVDENGEEYKLRFDIEGEELSDECVDEILSCDVGSNLIYAARTIETSIPENVVDPITLEPIEGIEVIQPKDLKAALEKK